MSHRSVPLETEAMPPGIPFIIGNEAAERFSFYGMKTILVVFMMEFLHVMDGSGGRAMSGSQAVEYYHQFSSWVYFTPLFGAILADVFLGKYRTILWLSIVYCLGHAALACMGSFGNASWWLVGGLLLVCLGSGGIKPCVSAHVGDQFGQRNHHLISRVYSWFYFSINFGSFFSTLLTPWLLEHYGPHWAFGVPGGLMAIATLMFWLGRNRFVHVPPSGLGFFKEAFSRDGLTALGKLIPLFVFIAIFWALYDQTGSAWVMQAKQMDLKFLGVEWLESQVQAVNPILILVFIPLFTFGIYPWIGRVFPLTPLRKIGLGMVLMTASFGLTTLIQTWIDAGGRPSIVWQVGAFFIITAAEVMVVIVALEFAYTQTPRSMKSWTMSLFWLSVWGGNQFTGLVNHFIAIPSAAEVQFVEATSSLPPEWQKSPRSIVLPGLDGETGTADDLVARCSNGRLERVEIPGREVYFAAAEKVQAAARNGFPAEAVAAGLLAGSKDPWGNPLKYDVIDSANARISSAGPDRKPNTAWDLGVLIEKTGQEHQTRGESWLDRRKRELRIGEERSAAGFRCTEFSGGQSRLEGAAYFRFFTWLVLAATLAFVPFAYFYRPKTYLFE